MNDIIVSDTYRDNQVQPLSAVVKPKTSTILWNNLKDFKKNNILIIRIIIFAIFAGLLGEAQIRHIYSIEIFFWIMTIWFGLLSIGSTLLNTIKAVCDFDDKMKNKTYSK